MPETLPDSFTCMQSDREHSCQFEKCNALTRLIVATDNSGPVYWCVEHTQIFFAAWLGLHA